MRRHLTTLLLTAAASLLSGHPVLSQTHDIAIEPKRRAPIEAGTTVTALFAITNRNDDTVRLMPHVDAPAQWTVLTGSGAATTMLVAARSTESLVVSIAVPARARAGIYPLRVSLTTPLLFSLATDSVLVVVPARRAVQVELVDRPAYVVVPGSYEVGFLLRNRGNVPTTVRLATRSRLGNADLLGEALARLEPDESRRVRVRARTVARLGAADDDVIELSAIVVDDSSQTAHASARVTVVPTPSSNIDDFARVPAQLRLRAAATAGVSPFEFAGAGALSHSGATQVDFLARGNGSTPGPFAERDEYRLEVRAPSWRLRGGDHLFALSPLTSHGRPGFGVGGDMTRDRWSVGIYGQDFRRDRANEYEAGGSLGARIVDGAYVNLTAVERRGGATGTVDILSAHGTFQRGSDRANVELAQSGTATGNGLAGSARFTGSRRSLTYDGGFVNADAAFAGPQPGTSTAYAFASAPVSRDVVVSLNGSMRSNAINGDTLSGRRERLDLGAVSVILDRRLTVEFGVASRTTALDEAPPRAGQQQSLRIRGDQPWRGITASVGLERGRASVHGSPSRGFGDVQAALRANVRGAMLAAFATYQDGGSVTKPEGAVALGGDASHRLFGTETLLSFFTTRQRVADAPWRSHLDARLRRTLRNDATLSLRMRLVDGGAPTERSAAFLEYSLPLRLPVHRLRTPGRVRGQIIDAVSGRGVSNALVRVGTQVALTDSKGEVAFAGLPAGEHRVSLAQEQSLADAVFIGDPTLRVDGAVSRPVTFRLQVARGAQLAVVVRRFASVRTAMDGAVDSLAAAGPEANVTLRLTSERDTLFRSSDEDGRAVFTDVPPGRWTIAVHSDAPPHHRFEPDRVDIMLAPGESHSLDLRLVPRQRDIRVIGGEQELRSVPRGTGVREQGKGQRQNRD